MEQKGERRPRSDLQRGIAIAFGACIGILLFVIVINVVVFGGILGVGMFGAILIDNALDDTAINVPAETVPVTDSWAQSEPNSEPVTTGAEAEADADFSPTNTITPKQEDTPQTPYFVTSDVLNLLPIKSRIDPVLKQAQHLPSHSIILVNSVETTQTGTWYMLSGWDSTGQVYSGYVHVDDWEAQDLRPYEVKR